jgi:hypothetical protein
MYLVPANPHSADYQRAMAVHNQKIHCQIRELQHAAKRVQRGTL